MRRTFLLGVTWIVLISLLTGVVAPAQAALPGPAQERSVEPAQRTRGKAGEPVPGRYIVTFRQGTLSGQAVSGLRRRLNLSVDRVFDRALQGFSARLSPEQVRALEADPEVLGVEPETWFEAFDAPLPTGVDRIGADSDANGEAPPRAGDPVAVLDTGIGEHPDLHVAGGHNCIGDDPTAYDDENGHGTHVAGTIGASGGISGVAPGTELWAVRVLDDLGFGTTGEIICGLEWVIEHRVEHRIVAINMSLGGPDRRGERATACHSSNLHRAICAARTAGLDIVVAAGNDNKNANGYVPAKYSRVITVAAMTDTDGCAGGRGGHSGWGRTDKDDRKWIWSNFGAGVDVIAPGVEITSTVPYGDGYDTYSGTSMAAPHVTGAIARGWDPKTGPRTKRIPGFGPKQGLVRLSANVMCRGVDPEEPTATPTIKVQPKTAQPGDRVTVRLRGYAAGERVRILLNGRRVDMVTIGADGSGTGRFRLPGGTDPGRYVVRGIGAEGGSDSVRLRVRD